MKNTRCRHLCKGIRVDTNRTGARAFSLYVIKNADTDINAKKIK